jgi:hypothetical protein
MVGEVVWWVSMGTVRFSRAKQSPCPCFQSELFEWKTVAAYVVNNIRGHHSSQGCPAPILMLTYVHGSGNGIPTPALQVIDREVINSTSKQTSIYELFVGFIRRWELIDFPKL